MKYDNKDDAKLYLSNSFLKYKDDFIYVMDVLSMTNVLCWSVKKHKEISIKLADIDYSTIPLGYYKDRDRDRLLFLERMPSRTWRQGLTQNNVVARGGHRFHMPNVTSDRMSSILMPTYKSFDKTLEDAKKTRRETAFHRTFSVDSDAIIRYKTKPIGEYRNDEFRLLQSCDYLKELLEKSL